MFENYDEQVFLATQKISQLLGQMATKAIIDGQEPVFIAALNHYMMVTAVVTIKGPDAPDEEIRAFLKKLSVMSIDAFMQNWHEVQQELLKETDL